MQQSYIVRVYRHDKDNPRMLVGTVEKVGEEGKAAFTNIDELWAVVNAAAWRNVAGVISKKNTHEELRTKGQGVDGDQGPKGGGI